MAKKKVGKKNAAKRMGATTSLLNPANPILLYGSIALGYFMGDKINTAIDGVAGDKIDTKIIAAGQVGLGYLLAKSKKKNLLTTVGGGVAIGAGVKRALTAFGIGGFYDVRAVNGFYDVKAVNGRNARRLGAYTPGGGGMGYNSRAGMNGSGLMNHGSSMMQ